MIPDFRFRAPPTASRAARAPPARARRFHEIAVVLKVAGVNIDPDTYKGLETLIDAGTLESLKEKYSDAFKDPPTSPPPPPP
jgi:hypothetical protein